MFITRSFFSGSPCGNIDNCVCDNFYNDDEYDVDNYDFTLMNYQRKIL